MDIVLTKLDSKDQDKFDTIIKNAHITVVDFFGTWCPPCIALGDQLAQTYKMVDIGNLDESNMENKVVIVKVDIDDCTEISNRSEFDIQTVPYVRFYKKGELLDGKVSQCKDVVLNINKLLSE